MKRYLILLILLFNFTYSSFAQTQINSANLKDAIKIEKKAGKLLAKGRLEESLELYRKAAELGSVQSIKLIRDFCQEANDVDGKAYWTKKLAEAGDAEAQFELGALYLYGAGINGQLVISIDEEKCIEWWERSAHQGNLAAADALGDLLSYGDDYPINYARAAEFYEIASKGGVAWAKRRLGWLYSNGLGLPENKSKAIALFEEASAAGDGISMYNLGCAYFGGDGVVVDWEKAKYWYQQAMKTDDEEAVTKSKQNLATIKMLESDTNPTKQDFETYLQGAELGQETGQLATAECYLNGWGVAKDVEKAIYWFKEAAKQGNLDAQTSLGIIYTDGQLVPSDLKLAKYWLSAPVAAADTTALAYMGHVLYQEGNFNEALSYIRQASNLGSKDAMRTLALMYWAGQGVEVNYAEALRYAKAARDMNPYTQFIYAMFVAQGVGTPADHATARDIFLQVYKNTPDEAFLPHMGFSRDIIAEQLGDCYISLDSFKKALEWYQTADLPRSWYQIGYIYASGKLGYTDSASAKKYMQKAARQNDVLDVKKKAQEALKAL